MACREILLVGSSTDPHLHRVADALRRFSDLHVVRLDPERDNFIVRPPFEQSETDVSRDSAATPEIILKDGRPRHPSVAFARPKIFPFLESTAQDDIERYIDRHAAAGAMEAITLAFGNRALNRPDACIRCSRKLPQVLAARRVGLPVLDTVLLNDIPHACRISSARRYVTKFEGFPLQPIATGSGKVTYRTIGTAHFDRKLASSMKAERSSPFLMQRHVAKHFEWRVFAMRERVFPFRYRSRTERFGLADSRWIYDEEAIEPRHRTFSPLEGPTTRFLESLELDYGVFDFVEDGDGKIHFLECNPHGEWLHLDDRVDGEISRHLASCIHRFVEGRSE